MAEKARLWNQTYVRVLAFTIYWLCGHEPINCFKICFSISAGDVINNFFLAELFCSIDEIWY